jgi:hypothetical protein
MIMQDYSVLASDMQDDRKIAARFILNFEAEKKKYEVAKRDYFERPQRNTEKVGGKGNLPGNPTQDAAIRSAQYDLDHPEYLWLKAVEIALKTFGERRRIFIAVRQEAAQNGHYNEGRPGRRAWVVYTQRRYAEEISKRFLKANGWMAERTVKSWWAQILDCIVEIHLRLRIKK